MARLDVRLDAERRRWQEEVPEERGIPNSGVARCVIDEAPEDVMRKRRVIAVERLVALEVEDPPDAATLSRSWRPPMSPAGFIDANVPIYAYVLERDAG